MSYRFRTGENGELVLQVQVASRYSPYEMAHEREPTWRDATVADIPVDDPFRRDYKIPTVSYNPETGEWGKS